MAEDRPVEQRYEEPRSNSSSSGPQGRLWSVIRDGAVTEKRYVRLTLSSFFGIAADTNMYSIAVF